MDLSFFHPSYHTHLLTYSSIFPLMGLSIASLTCLLILILTHLLVHSQAAKELIKEVKREMKGGSDKPTYRNKRVENRIKVARSG